MRSTTQRRASSRMPPQLAAVRRGGDVNRSITMRVDLGRFGARWSSQLLPDGSRRAGAALASEPIDVTIDFAKVLKLDQAGRHHRHRQPRHRRRKRRRRADARADRQDGGHHQPHRARRGGRGDHQLGPCASPPTCASSRPSSTAPAADLLLRAGLRAGRSRSATTRTPSPDATTQIHGRKEFAAGQ